MKKKSIMLCVASALVACGLSAVAVASNASSVDWDAVIAANPTDPYVETYTAEETTDLMTMHRALGYTCADCHGDEIAEQVGTYDEVLDATESDEGTREMCLSCHSWERIVDETVLAGDVSIYNTKGLYNVHDNHRGDVDCGECHSMHETQTLNCVWCHYMELPEGWDGFK